MCACLHAFQKILPVLLETSLKENKTFSYFIYHCGSLNDTWKVGNRWAWPRKHLEVSYFLDLCCILSAYDDIEVLGTCCPFSYQGAFSQKEAMGSSKFWVHWRTYLRIGIFTVLLINPVVFYYSISLFTQFLQGMRSLLIRRNNMFGTDFKVL